MEGKKLITLHVVTVYGWQTLITKIRLGHPLIITHVLYCAHRHYRTAESLTISNSKNEHNQNVSRYLSRYREIPIDKDFKYRLLHVKSLIPFLSASFKYHHIAYIAYEQVSELVCVTVLKTSE